MVFFDYQAGHPKQGCLPQREPMARNTPGWRKADYYLAENQEGLRLELVNWQEGQVVRTFKADAPKGEKVDTARNMSTEFTELRLQVDFLINSWMNHFQLEYAASGSWNKDPKKSLYGNGRWFRWGLVLQVDFGRKRFGGEI